MEGRGKGLLYRLRGCEDVKRVHEAMDLTFGVSVGNEEYGK